MKYLWRNKIALIIIALIVVFIQPAISLPEQSKTENIVTAFGVDKTEEEFEVSVQYILPFKSGAENELKVSSVKGKNISETIEQLSVQFGKNSGFAHCKFIILSDKVCEQNITSVLDYFIRIKSNATSIILLNANQSAKDVLSTANSINSELYTVVDCNCYAAFQQHYLDFNDIGNYYDSYLGKTKCLTLNVLGAEEEQDSSSSSSSEGSSSGASSSDASSSSSSSPSKKKLKNDGIIAIIKDGKKLLELTKEESYNLNFFNNSVKDHYLTLEHFSDNVYDDVEITFDIYNKKAKISTSFINGIPHYKLDVKVNLRINQVISENMNVNYYDFSKFAISDELKKAIQDSVKEKLTLAEINFKTNKYDVVKCFDSFYKFQNKEFKEFLSSLGPDEYFIEKVVFDYDINAVQHL